MTRRLRVEFRPLLVQGMLLRVGESDEWLMLIDSEQSREEQGITIIHELLHFAGLEDEELVERLARELWHR